MPDIVSGENPIAVTLYNDRRNEETQVEIAPALAALLAWANAWTAKTARGDPATLTFSSMLAAMVSGKHPLCDWLRQHLALRGVSTERVARGLNVGKPVLPAGRIVTSHSFRQALAEARALAGGRLLDVRHFMAAYVVVPHYHREDFLRLRIDRRAWCLALADKLIASYPEEASEWAAYGQRAPAVMLPGFDADLPRGADLLGIGREVEAFAMLVAGRDTLTPLSIGLFGGWGTGKSYFMARLEERVAALSAAGPSDAYFGRVAQVRFNAWHYSESNIIASLVDQILRNLRFGPDEDEEMLRERRAQVMAEMTTAEDQRRRAERELESAATSETALRDALDRVRREADEEARRKQADLAATARAIEDAQSLLQQSFISEDDARAAALRRAPAAEAASFVTRTMLEDEDIQRLSRGLTQARDNARWVGLNQMNILWGVAAITLTVLAAFSVESLKDTKLFTGVVGLVAAITPVAASWLSTLRTLSARGAEFQAAIRARAEAAVKKIEEHAASERQRLEANITRQQAAATALQAQLGALEVRTAEATTALAAGEQQRRQANDALAAATADIAAKRAQLDAVTSGSLLEEAVAGLAAKEDYRRELGTIARARTDFERLSRRMTKARMEYEAGETSNRPVLDRLVLYVDDRIAAQPTK